jgi:hypothetical protein
VAAHAVRSAQESRQAIATARPRGVAVLRSRAPLALLIRLAALEGRLVWRSPDAFAVLEAPTRGNLPEPSGPPGTGMLRFLNRHWDQMIFGSPALLALALAAVLAFFPAERTAALLAALFVMVWAGAVLTLVVLTGLIWVYRVLIAGRVKDLSEEVIGQLCALHWSIALLHADRPSEVAEILVEVSRCVTATVHGDSGGAGPGSPGDSRSDVVLCLEHGVTTMRARDAVQASEGVSRLPGHPVLIVSLGRDSLLREPPTSPTHPAAGIPLLLLSMATVVGFGAQQVAEFERARCAPTSCTGRPASYGDALYWLLNRLLGGDPEGLAAGSLQARSMGLLTSIMGLVIIGWVIASALQRAVARVVSSGPELARDYNLAVTRALSAQHAEHQPAAGSPPAAPPQAATSLVLAGGVIVMGVIGYVLGRAQRRSRRD